MKSTLIALAMILGLTFFDSRAFADVSGYEPWKSPLSEKQIQLGVMTGLGVVNNTGGFTILGTVAKKLLNQGFAPEINNQVYMEAHGGALTVSRGSAFMFSLHLRWNFTLDDQWIFYGLGGVGGNVTSKGFGEQFQVLPRFAAGALLNLEHSMQLPLWLRGEVSHELIAAGIMLPF